MRRLLLCLFFSSSCLHTVAQSGKTELYDLIKSLLSDSTGYENVGDWAVGNPKKFRIVWKSDQLIISPDTSINFYRLGTANLTIRGKNFVRAGQPVQWNIMLKGARSGYSSFSIISTTSTEIQPRYTIDTVFGFKPFKAKLLKSCDAKDLAGYYYYELKLPKKDLAYIKLSWLSINGSTAMRIDCFDNWSRYAVKLHCPD